MLTAVDIRNAEFYRAARGYKTEEVDVFIEQVAQTVEALQRDNQELMRKLEVLADKIEEYRKDEDSIRTALLTAQRMGDQIVREAKESVSSLVEDSEKQAAETIAEAKKKAEQIMSETEKKSVQLVKDTKDRATAVIAEAKDRSGRMILEALEASRAEKSAYDQLKNETADFRAKLLAMYKAQLELINQIPSERPAPEEHKAEMPEQKEEKIASLEGLLFDFPEAFQEEESSETDHVEQDHNTVTVEMQESESTEEPQEERRLCRGFKYIWMKKMIRAKLS